MLWCKQFYHYDVQRWLDGDPASASAPFAAAERAQPRLAHLDNRDVISMPDRGSTPGTPHGTWPSTASRSPTSTRRFAKITAAAAVREWYMHPNGQLPAYEWDFGDVNPPVHAWAALRGLRMMPTGRLSKA